MTKIESADSKWFQKCFILNKILWKMFSSIQNKNWIWKVVWFLEIFFRFVWVLSFSDLFGNDEQWPESSPVSNDIVMLSSSPPASSLEVLCIFCITKWHCSMWCIRSFITYITKSVILYYFSENTDALVRNTYLDISRKYSFWILPDTFTKCRSANNIPKKLMVKNMVTGCIQNH